MSCSREKKNDLKVSVGIEPQALSGTSDLAGEIIDTQDFESLTYVLSTDAIAASSLDAQLEIEEGDEANLSDAAAVADADLVGLEDDTAIAETDDKVSKKIGYVGNKRYVRANLVVTANDGTDVVSCLAIQAHANAKPVA